MKFTNIFSLLAVTLAGSLSYGEVATASSHQESLTENYFTNNIALLPEGLCQTTGADFDAFSVKAQVAQSSVEWGQRFQSGQLEDDIAILEAPTDSPSDLRTLSKDFYELDPKGYIVFKGFVGDGESSHDVYVYDSTVNGEEIDANSLQQHKLTIAGSLPCESQPVASASSPDPSGFIKVDTPGGIHNNFIHKLREMLSHLQPMPSSEDGDESGHPRPYRMPNGAIEWMTPAEYQEWRQENVISNMVQNRPKPPTQPARPPRPSGPSGDGSRPTTSHGTSHDSPHASGCSCTSTTEGTGPRKRTRK